MNDKITQENQDLPEDFSEYHKVRLRMDGFSSEDIFYFDEALKKAQKTGQSDETAMGHEGFRGANSAEKDIKEPEEPNKENSSAETLELWDEVTNKKSREIIKPQDLVDGMPIKVAQRGIKNTPFLARVKKIGNEIGCWSVITPLEDGRRSFIVNRDGSIEGNPWLFTASSDEKSVDIRLLEEDMYRLFKKIEQERGLTKESIEDAKNILKDPLAKFLSEDGKHEIRKAIDSYERQKKAAKE